MKRTIDQVNPSDDNNYIRYRGNPSDDSGCIQCHVFYSNRDGLCSQCYMTIHGISIVTSPSIPHKSLDPKLYSDPYELIKRTRFTLPSNSQLVILKRIFADKTADQMAEILSGHKEFPPLLIEYRDYLNFVKILNLDQQKQHVLFTFCFDYWKIDTGGVVHCYHYADGPQITPPKSIEILKHWYDTSNLFYYQTGGLVKFKGDSCCGCDIHIVGYSRGGNVVVRQHNISFCKCGAIFHRICFVNLQLTSNVCLKCSRALKKEYVTKIASIEWDLYHRLTKHDAILDENDEPFNCLIDFTPKNFTHRISRFSNTRFLYC